MAGTAKENEQTQIAEVHAFLQEGLQGNRNITTPLAWHVVLAMGRAYPLLLSDSIAQAGQFGKGDEALSLRAWTEKAIETGTIQEFLLRILSQPQITSAYSSLAPVRDKSKALALTERLKPMQTKRQGAQEAGHFQHSSPDPALPMTTAPISNGPLQPDVSIARSQTAAADSNYQVQPAEPSLKNVSNQPQPVSKQGSGHQGGYTASAGSTFSCHVHAEPAPEMAVSKGSQLPPQPALHDEYGHNSSQRLAQRSGSNPSIAASKAGHGLHPLAQYVEEDAPHIETEEDALRRKQEANAARPQYRVWSALANMAAAAHATAHSKTASGPDSSPSLTFATEQQQQQQQQQQCEGEPSSYDSSSLAAKGQGKENGKAPDGLPLASPSTASTASASTLTTGAASHSSRVSLGYAWQGLSAVSAYVPGRWGGGGGSKQDTDAEFSKETHTGAAACSQASAPQPPEYSTFSESTSSSQVSPMLAKASKILQAITAISSHPPSSIADSGTPCMCARVHVIRKNGAPQDSSLPLVLLRLEVNEPHTNGCDPSNDDSKDFHHHSINKSSNKSSNSHGHTNSKSNTVTASSTNASCRRPLLLRARIWVLPDASNQVGCAVAGLNYGAEAQLVQLSIEELEQESAKAAADKVAQSSALCQRLYGLAASAAAYAASSAASRLSGGAWSQCSPSYLGYYLGSAGGNAGSGSAVEHGVNTSPGPQHTQTRHVSGLAPGQTAGKQGCAQGPHATASHPQQHQSETAGTGAGSSCTSGNSPQVQGSKNAGNEPLGNARGGPGDAGDPSPSTRSLPYLKVKGLYGVSGGWFGGATKEVGEGQSGGAGAGALQEEPQQEVKVGEDGEDEEEEVLEDLRQVLTQSDSSMFDFPSPLDVSNGLGYHGAQSRGSRHASLGVASTGTGFRVGEHLGEVASAAGQQANLLSRRGKHSAHPYVLSGAAPLTPPQLQQTQHNSNTVASGAAVQQDAVFPIQAVKVVGHTTMLDGHGESFTAYKLEVAAAPAYGGSTWKVARRFSDFVQIKRVLLQALAASPTSQSSSSPTQGSGHCLPPCWDELSQGRSVLGRARFSTKVVESRQGLLQQCMQTLLHAATSAGTSFISTAMRNPDTMRVLLHFLGAPSSLNASRSAHQVAPSNIQLLDQAAQQHCAEDGGRPQLSGAHWMGPEGGLSSPHATHAPAPTAGLTIKLITHVVPILPEGQLLSQQGGLCAGCKTCLPCTAPAAAHWSWGSLRSNGGAGGGPPARVCWYTGGLFCCECHTNDIHLIPGRVLHKWDLQPRPVCCAAAEFLAEVAARPVLCVSAINPDLLRRVTSLLRAQGLRQAASKSMNAARAAGGTQAAHAENVFSATGPRSYLLSSSLADFWALNDLAELSKGPLSSLLPWLEATARDLSLIVS